MADQAQKMGINNPAFVPDGEPVQLPKHTQKDPDGIPGVGVAGPKILTPAEKKEKFAIMKNIIIISIAFTFLFTSYNSMANLQSSINKATGTAAQTALYAAFIFSCCFLPSWMIRRLREKYTMAACMLCYSTYMAAQFYPELYTLVPTAVVVGLGAAPMWSAKCTYLTKVGTIYADLVGVSSDVIITRFFGIFFLFFQSTQVWGNVISSTVLSVGVADDNKTEDDLQGCGYHFCPWDTTGGGDDSSKNDTGGIPPWQRYTMSSIYLVFALLSSFEKKNSESPESNESTTKLLANTFNHIRHPYQVFIIPITIWSGLEQGFLGADFTAAYVSCGLGVHMVGYVMICYGLCDAVCSYSFTPLVKAVGRVPVFSMGAVINLGVIITLKYWTPRPDDLAVFFVLSGLWGVADAVWQTQINALYGVIFPGESEAAFSNYRLWESTGFIISYACSTLVCIEPKIIILLVFLVLGILGYYAVEVLERRGGLRKDGEGKVVYIDQLVSGKY
ncbi:UNC93-like protein [Penaeus japonicus]|uniref:UNC93-like protein n=1 Tax=Penaeus japonicus TaxID=27405 RepID=UPI001C71401F|nr:UNC93-like protein [Penaeus japonicus]